MSEGRKKHRAKLWTAVALAVVLAGSLLSFGPACWIAGRSVNMKISRFYWPIQTYVPRCPGGGAAVAWYAKLGVPKGSRGVLVPFHDREGHLAWVRYAADADAPRDPGAL